VDVARQRDRVLVEDPAVLEERADEATDGGIVEAGTGWLSNPHVAQAVKRLPRAQREVIELRFGRDLSTAQTAAEMGIQESTVRRHQNEALATIEERLQRTGEAERLCSRRLDSLIRIIPARVMSRRRFALTAGFTPAGTLMVASTRRFESAPFAGRRRW
jgi:hypothetical protein